jgi:hypothetical protein
VPSDVAAICSLEEVDRKNQREGYSFQIFLARKSPYPQFPIPSSSGYRLTARSSKATRGERRDKILQGGERSG